MTDNEKRSHDLAIMATKCLLEIKLDANKTYNKNHPNTPKDFEFDPFAEYIAYYDILLARFNEPSA
jgi:hypothetical protein